MFGVLDYLTTPRCRCTSCCTSSCHSYGCASNGCARNGCACNTMGSYEADANALPPRPVPVKDTVWADR